MFAHLFTAILSTDATAVLRQENQKQQKSVKGPKTDRTAAIAKARQQSEFSVLEFQKMWVNLCCL